MPWWGVWALLRVVAGTDPEEAFGPIELTGHHLNWAARGFARLFRMSVAVALRLNRSRKPSTTPAYAVHRHLLRTIVAPTLARLASRQLWAGCARPMPFAARRANARCNGGFATT